MVACAHLAAEFGIPICDIPFKATGSDDRWATYGYNADVLGKETSADRRADFVHTLFEKKADALGVYEEELTVWKESFGAGFVEMM